MHDGKYYLEQMNDITPFAGQEACIKYGCTLDHLGVMQMNIGKKCNLVCKHCHIQAGPNRTEEMSREVMDACLRVFQDNGFETLDITGGAPEMNENLKYLIEQAVAAGIQPMVRSNLVIFEEPGYGDFPEFYASHKVHIVASLPHYSKKQMERQRGAGSYDGVIKGIQKLNSLGYGTDPELQLDLVYNPGGAFMPSNQDALHKEYAEKLNKMFGIHFNNLFAITNNPIGRFGDFLERSGNYRRYMENLVAAFNPKAVETMMCRNQISVDYDGTIYDCDFNLALGLPANIDGKITDIVGRKLEPRKIVVANHCYACTAGAGSSCGGTTA